MSLLVKDCDWVVTQNSRRDILRETSVLISEGRIVEIGDKIKQAADRVVDGRGCVLLPGLINAHTHLSMTLFRGYADDMELHEWLANKIWPLETKLTAEACYYGALLGCLEMIRTGTTTFVDMYFYMQDVARAVGKAGLRGILSYGVIDLFDEGRAQEEKEKTAAFLNFVKSLDNDRVQFAVGPHAPYTCSAETLLWAKELAERERCILHLHVGETRKEQTDIERAQKARVVEYLHRIGALSPQLLAAHCVWLSKAEVKLLGEARSSVAHCPVSNMKIATGGFAPLPEMFEFSVPVGLGTDGAASNNTLDMFETMKFCALGHKAYRWDPTLLPAQKVLDLATIEAARAIRAEKELGSIEPGKKADMILVSLNAPHLQPIHGKETVLSDLVYAARGADVTTTIVDGQVLMESGQVRTLDQSEVFERVGSIVRKMIS
jgi:5-methylthioadenosine/S-adenosylhomocysteine deaminase